MGSQRVRHDWATFTFRTRKTKIIYQQQLCPQKSKRNQFKQKGNDPSRKFISWEIKSKRKSRYPRKCKKTVFTFLDSLKYVWFLKAKFIPLSDGICHTCRCEIYIYVNIHPLQYSCLGHPMDRGAWQATVHKVAKSRIWLSIYIHMTIITKISGWG